MDTYIPFPTNRKTYVLCFNWKSNKFQAIHWYWKWGQKIQSKNIEASLFIDPDTEQIDLCVKAGVKVIELHTGTYADAQDENIQAVELNRLTKAAEHASKNGIRVHAGHGLNLSNLSKICKIPQVKELNIGHAIIADSIFKGLEKSVQAFRSKIDND